MNKKRVIRFVVFSLLVVLLVTGLTKLVLAQPDYAQTDQRFRTYRRLQDGAVDVVFTGTSGIDRYWIAAKAFEEYGITAYPLSSDSQPSWLVKNVIEEAKKTQEPKLFVIDMRSFTSQYGKRFSTVEAGARYLTDSICLSGKNKVDAINRSLEALNMINPDEELDTKTFYFPLLKHHGVWGGLDEFDHAGAKSELGYYMCPIRTIRKTSEFEDVSGRVTEVGEMHPVAYKYLIELLDYFDTQDHEVLFINTPQGRSDYEMTTLNAVVEVLEERSYNYIIYNIADQYDMEEHFYNEGHVNYYGAEKFTATFAQYLKDNYNLEDRREDKECQDWYGYYDAVKDTIKEWEADKAAKAEKVDNKKAEIEETEPTVFIDNEVEVPAYVTSDYQ